MTSERQWPHLAAPGADGRTAFCTTVLNVLHGRTRPDIPLENEHVLLFIPAIKVKGEGEGDEPFHDIVIFLDDQADESLVGGSERAWVLQVAGILQTSPGEAEGLGPYALTNVIARDPAKRTGKGVVAS
ncbi:hypothetical protein FISHEDRAFT_58797 [Fistulina hepatica ATCC 64428]|uniref:Uncharacterized protein n=1 Tax=Fistulina hepatica ATCC 64428 TaxID=1128425 RepID=A0A0D7ADM5_9AGAR|nr:hypothetical protein FISHEDRAFT_58797 [Fistulina hepatica ATCC 64428]